ncbi:MAG: sulfatase [Betaproteobacteria bacterium RIFCSPLOWO2_02_64_14]|nr:MAG: sulfatase [Betaproteobacteria bacterium RIFCSPLOWO2_02_64_14]
MSAKRPNILLITSDQQRADCNGFENPRIRTPHTDGLARAGTRFAACITPNLVCQPSRASILTGLLPLTHGVWDNGVDLDPRVGEQGFAGTLARAGYQTAFIGKAHFSTKSTFAPTGTPECNKSQAQYGPNWFGPYMGFEHVELCVLGHLHRTRKLERPPVGHYERWLVARGSDEEGIKRWAQDTRAGTGAAQTWYSALPVAWHNTTWAGDRAIDWLVRQRDTRQPFCAWVSFPDPHHPFDCPEPWSRMYDPKDMVLPAHRVRDLGRRPWWHKASLENKPQLTDPEMLKFRAEGSRVPDQSDAQLAEMTANYYGMISLIDHNVGRILTALDDLGIAEDTLVVYTTDHGEMLGNHGLYLKGPTPYEDLLRVTMVARGPGVAKGAAIAEPVSTLDLAATFYDAAGESAPRALQGRSLVRLLRGDAETRDLAWSEWHVHPSRCGVPLKLRTVRTRTHKCTFELESGAGELYDLANDPGEMNNLFDDPGYAAVRKELHAMMRARPGKVREDLPEPIGMA